MKIGLQIPNFTMPGGAVEMGRHLGEIARAADDAGFSSIWAMDHFFQIGSIGPAEMEMLEGYSALSFLAGMTRRVRLGTMVTGVTYRHPGLLAKTVTTLDVLSGGRAYLGIGAAWNEREHLGLGVPFPPVAERFERLEEALLIALQMWSGEVKPFAGKHYRLAETLNSPPAVSRPHPPILIGGGGEKKTLRLVAQYADACNLFAGDVSIVKHKLEILRGHCDRLGRRYEDIEKTTLDQADLGGDGSQSASQFVDKLGRLADLGIQHAIVSLRDVWTLRGIEVIEKEVLSQVAKL